MEILNNAFVSFRGFRLIFVFIGCEQISVIDELFCCEFLSVCAQFLVKDWFTFEGVDCLFLCIFGYHSVKSFADCMFWGFQLSIFLSWGQKIHSCSSKYWDFHKHKLYKKVRFIIDLKDQGLLINDFGLNRWNPFRIHNHHVE